MGSEAKWAGTYLGLAALTVLVYLGASQAGGENPASGGPPPAATTSDSMTRFSGRSPRFVSQTACVPYAP